MKNGFLLKIDRNGDLINKCYLEITVANESGSDNLFNMISNNGFNFIDFIEIEIGGQLIDKQCGEWMSIWNELTLSCR